MVLLVGDDNQLPPVGPGNILRDLIQTRAIPTVVLDKVVRQAGVLKENCTAILKGEVRKTSEIWLQLVEFIQSGTVTAGESGPMPDSHRQARDYLAKKAGLPPPARFARPARTA